MIHTSAIDLSGREREYVNDCLSRGWLTQGKYVRRFEELFAEVCGARYAIACNSGTSALHLAMLALSVNKAGSVIIPALTYIATANAARYCEAKTYFCDVDRDNWTMDTKKCKEIAKLISSAGHSRVFVIPVHLYDCAAEVDNTLGTVVEDAAHVIGPCLGTIRVASFYASKIIACGEGGMILTDSETLAGLVKLYRGQGATIPGRYHHSVIGYNYRMTDLQAAIGLAQLERLPEILARRREVVARYRSNLSGTAITLQGGERASGWVCAVLVPENVNRDTVAFRLYSTGIETRPFFEPLHTLPPYIDCEANCPVAESIAKRGLCLPTHTLLTDADIDYVCGRLLAEVEAAT